MRILLVKPKHIGDTLLLTPTISGIQQAYPDAEIWVVVRRGCAGILAGCAGIHRILTLAAVDKSERRRGDGLRDLGTLLRLLGVRFDYVFELGDGHRGRFFATLCRAKRRYSVKPLGKFSALELRRFTGLSTFDWSSSHRVEKDYRSVAEFLPLPETIPSLHFDRTLTRSWVPGDELTDFCVMQIGKRQEHGRWLRERSLEVGRHLLGKAGALVIVSGPADHEVGEATWLREQLGPRVICTLGKADWAQVAGLLYRAKLYVGVDSAATHLAAACGCPTVVLFGPTEEIHWRPWQVSHRIVTTERLDGMVEAEVRYRRVLQREMNGIQAAEVMAACDDLLAERASSA